MLYVLHGPDQFRAREELRRIRRELDHDGNLAHNTQRLEARGLSAAELRAACQTASFFADSRLVIIEGLQQRFSGTRRRRTASGRPRAAEASAPSDFEQFVEVLSNLPSSTTVVLLDESAATAFLEAVAEIATVRQYGVLRGPELRQWAAQRAKERGAVFAAGALERLLALVDGNHLGELAQEIDKLATYAGGRSIDSGAIDDLVSGAVQYQLWDLTDAVVEGRSERALGVLQAMDARDHPRQLLIFMLTRQYRQLLLAQALLRDGMGAAQIGTQLGLRDYPLRKTIEQASRYPADRLEAAYRRLFETDVAVKTGVLDVDTALEVLIVDLTEMARAPRGARAGR